MSAGRSISLILQALKGIMIVSLFYGKSSVDIINFQDNFMELYGSTSKKDLVTFLTTHRINQRFLYEGKKIKTGYTL